ncbi:MAG: protein translocase subunit SecD [Alphaproteobacteria bacterium]|nr:protein translocase subunit SecD [Alphaproteobacteria bacterium]
MLKVAPWRIILVAVVAAFGVLFALPNVLPANVLRTLPPWVQNATLNLGLDLRGGSHLLLEIDTATLERQRLDQVLDQMRQAMRDAEPRITITGPGVVGGAARIRLANVDDAPRAMRALQDIINPIGAGTLGGGEPDLAFTEGEGGLIEARVTPQALDALARQAVQQSIEIIRRRVDPTGTSEVSITRQGADRIVVQAPGESDPESLRRRIGQTARLTFHLVDQNVDPADAAAGRVPPSAMVLPFANPEQGGGIVVRRRPALTGELLNDARPGFDPQTREPVVNFRFNGQGARIFGRLTTENVGKPFAIVLDDRVLTAPNIREPILGGSGQISGSFTAESANELAVLLRAGALPAPLTVIEQRSVGAELGQDAIEAGSYAGIVAGIGVLVFMILAYGLFGIIACVSLIVNGVLIIAAMSMIGAALTLPGIAGLILTIAMAVDANVLIYERMREEQANGRGPALAIDAGFSRAMVTIMDANLTTILAALILFQFGAGPVRGFAWTLSIGVITSVFTAVLVTQILIAWWFRAVRPKRLPI